MPLIHKQNPNILLHIIGSNPPSEILKLSSNKIKVWGYVENVDKLFNFSRVFVSPLRYGAGIKGKINLAMEYGLPVVGTSIGFEGMHMKSGKDCIVANDTQAFASSVLSLYNDKKLWNKISTNSIRVLERHFSPSTAKDSLQDLIFRIQP